MHKEDKTAFRRLFRDIVRGYTIAQLGKSDVFIKHLTTHDQVDLEDIEENFFETAKKRGVPTEEESLESLIKDGAWSEKEQSEIDKQEAYVQSLVDNKKQLILKSQLDERDKLIEKEKSTLIEKIAQKAELVGNTCEKYAKQRVNDYYISRSFYRDKKLKKPLYSEKEFDEVSYSELSNMIKLHNEQFVFFSEENIQQLTLEDFYSPYMPFAEDTVQFFGEPASKITLHQLKLILYTRIFKSIFDHNEDIPDHIRKDPQALLDFASSSKKGKEELDKHQEKGGATTLVGATKEDYEYMGEKSETVSIHEAAKQKGGSLNMSDLMEMTGD